MLRCTFQYNQPQCVEIRSMRHGMLPAFLACFITLWLGPLAFATHDGDSAAADSAIETVAHDYVKNSVELSRLNAAQNLAKLRPPASSAVRPTGDRNLLKEMSVLAEMYADKAKLPLNNAREEAAHQTSEMSRHWEDARAELLRVQEKRMLSQGNKNAVSQFAFLFSAQNKWFWLCGLLALLAPAGAVIFERRHELRRVFKGGKGRSTIVVKGMAAAFVVLAGLAAIVFLAGDKIYMSTIVGLGKITPLEQDRQEAEKMAKQIQEKAGETAKSSTGGLDFRGLDGGAQQKLREAGTALEDLQVELQVQNEINNKRKADLKSLSDFEKDIETAQRDSERAQATQAKYKFGLGMVLLLGAAGIGYLVQWGMNERAATIANTCPLCLTVGKLQPVNLDTGGQGRGQLEKTECLASGCDFSFLTKYRKMEKLCFPTLGLAKTGKTHWVAEVYRQVKKGNYDKKIQFEKVTSDSSELFDKTVDDILTSRQGPNSTQTGKLPHPLIFNFLDRDWPVRSNPLVNVFDYGGEVTAGRTLDDYARRRALDADGYFYFLDPTLESHEQSHALDRFKEDVAAIKATVSEKLRCPVALIIPKIDLMVNQPYAGGQGGQDFVTRFYRQLIDLDPTRTQVSLELIEARSNLFAKLRDIIWPGWEIERLVDDLFGGRFMFFPLTPVGLDEPGETILKNRTIRPYLILEPLLWMLHMNGFPVFK